MKIGTLVTLTLLLLCGFAGAQSTFCSSGSNCAYTGNSTHSGAETFKNINNVYYTSAAIDGVVYADECAAIAAAWTYAQAKGWTGIHVVSGWTGTQSCAASPFTGFPYVVGNTPTFSARIDLLPSNEVRTPVSWVIPSNVLIDGGTSHGPFGASVNNGAVIRVANTFPTATPLIQYGASTWSGVVGQTPPQGIQLRNLTLIGTPPSGSFLAGSIGILNQFAQENSGADNLHIDGFQIGLALRNGGTISGSENSGPWTRLHINFNGSNTANARCFVIGDDGVATAPLREIAYGSCNINGSSVDPAIGATIDGSSVTVRDFHFEGFPTAIEVGSINFAQSVLLEQISGVGFVSHPMTSLIDISAHDTNNTRGITVINAKAVGTVTNVLKDNLTNGGTATVATSSEIGMYERDSNNTVFSTHPDIKPNMQFAGAPVAFKTADYTAVAGDNGKFLPFNCASACTLTLPATNPPSASWSIEVANYGAGTLTVNPNGVTMNGSTNSVILPANGSTGLRINSTSTNYYYNAGFPYKVGTIQITGCQINFPQTTTTMSATDATMYTCTIPANLLTVGAMVNCHVDWTRVTPSTAGMLWKWKWGTDTVTYSSVTNASATSDTDLNVYVKTSSTEQLNGGKLFNGVTIGSGRQASIGGTQSIGSSITVLFTGAWTSASADVSNTLQSATCTVTP